jgi:hypothetical protein
VALTLSPALTLMQWAKFHRKVHTVQVRVTRLLGTAGQDHLEVFYSCWVMVSLAQLVTADVAGGDWARGVRALAGVTRRSICCHLEVRNAVYAASRQRGRFLEQRASVSHG